MSSVEFDCEDLRVTVEYGEIVNYALQRNDLPVVTGLHIEHVGEEPVEDLQVAIRARQEAAEQVPEVDGWSEHVARLEPEHIWNTREVDVEFPREELVQLDERKETTLELSVAADGTEESDFALEVTRLPYNQ